MTFLTTYCCICYLMAFVAVFHSKHMPFIMALIAPISVPMTISFMYADKLDDTFGNTK